MWKTIKQLFALDKLRAEIEEQNGKTVVRMHYNHVCYPLGPFEKSEWCSMSDAILKTFSEFGINATLWRVEKLLGYDEFILENKPDNLEQAIESVFEKMFRTKITHHE